MSETITRREFLKVSTAVGAATVISGCTANLQRTEYLETYVHPPEEGLPGQDLWYASTCRQCPAGCGIIVRVSEGRAKKVEGNPLHPVSQGALCARGQAGLQVLYNPDRVRNALHQTGGRGSRQFEPLYWDDALAELKERLDNVSTPAAIAFLGGEMPDHLLWIVERYLEALGAPPPVVYSTHSAFEGRQALRRANKDLFGVDRLPVYDIARAQVVFSFSSAVLSTALSPVYYNMAYSRMRNQVIGRGTFVHFESRLSQAGAAADRWIPVAPGMEGAVALILGRLILDLGLARNERAAPYYANVDVETLAAASDVDLETLENLAHTFARVDRPLAIPGGAVAGQVNGVQATIAVHMLNVLMDNLGKPGGMWLAPDGRGSGLKPQTQPATFEQVQELVERMKAGHVEVLFLDGSNPVFTLPASLGLADAISRVPFVVSFSSFVDETSVLADYILPAHTYLESWGYQVVEDAPDRLTISGQQPVVQPYYDTRDVGDVFLFLAQESEAARRVLPWRNMVEFLQGRLTQLREMGVAGSFPLEDGVRAWGAWRRFGGWWAQEPGWEAPRLAPDVALTPRVVPDFEGGADYPLVLYPYETVALTDGRGANQPWLQELPDPMTTATWETWVEINPETAHMLGVKMDDVVRVISPYGEVEAIVYTYPAIHPGVVAMPLGRGHTDYGRYARGHGANPMHLLGSRVARETRDLAWLSVRVKIKPTGRTRRLPRVESNVGVDRAREMGFPG